MNRCTMIPSSFSFTPTHNRGQSSEERIGELTPTGSTSHPAAGPRETADDDSSSELILSPVIRRNTRLVVLSR